WLWLGLVATWFIAIAAWKRIYPYYSLLILTLVPCILAAGLFLWPSLALVVLVADAAVALTMLVDLRSLPKAADFVVRRELLKVASIQKNHRVTLVLSNQSSRSRLVWVRDDIPQDFTAEPEQAAIAMTPNSRATFEYDLFAQRRGAFELNKVYLRVRSRFGFWQRFLSYELPATINVYPDMKQLAEYAILARANRLAMLGVRRTRKVGQDNEFERLRDYSPDDNYKHIDWRATARRNRLTVKDYQVNQSQRIIFMLDCGRMMTNECQGLSLLDHAMNSMLMLSHVALRQGDSVGLISFSDEVHSYVPPRGGMRQMNQLIHATFDRFPNRVESRYDEAFLYLASRCRKRSLVVLFSNLIDEVNSNQLHQYLSSIMGRHLPLGVLLRDHTLFDAADDPSAGSENLFRSAAAAEILTWRHQVLTDLQHQGVLCLDVFPEQMTAPLVNQYLEIKARHLL
ncbi:MAG: hypothetical protein RIS70_3000, partial [Planctomycetota bacterium]